MIACVCHGISTRHVEAHAREGACSITELGRRSGAGTACGRCHERLDALLARHRERREEPEALAAK